MIAESFAQFLLNNVAITAITLEIRPLLLLDGHDDPAIVYMQADDEKERTLGSFSALQRARFFVDCYSTSYSQARGLAETVRAELENYRGAFGDHTVEQVDFDYDADLFEDDTRLYRVALRLTMWYSTN